MTRRLLAAGLIGLAAVAQAAEPVTLTAREPLPLEETGTIAPVLFQVAGLAPKAAVRAWRIEITDARRGTVAVVKGRGAVPKGAIPFFPVASTGDLLPGGFYWARLVWIDENEGVHNTRVTAFAFSTAHGAAGAG